MSFSKTVHLGNKISLLLAMPNMGEGYQLRYSIGTILEEGLSGKENRRPIYEALRIEQECTYLMEAAEADAFRLGLQDLGTALVGVPLWCDALLGSQWADRIHTAQYLVRFSNGSIVAGDSTLVAGESYAPLLVGRLKEKPVFSVLNENIGEISLTVREASPWEYRIAPKDTVSASAFPASLSPDWTQLADRWTDGIEAEPIGEGRVLSITGDEKAPKWGQEASFTLGTRDEIRTMLGFFYAAKGRWASFDAPVWFRPGPNTNETPHETKCRLAADSLALKFESGACATTQLSLWQVPWEINPVEGETPQQAAKAYLYKFTYDLPSPVVTRWTNYEKPLTRTGDGTYTTATIEHDSITQGITMDASTVSLVSDRFAGNPLLIFAPFRAEARLLLEIRECDPANVDSTASLVWSGEIETATATGKTIKATGSQFGDVFERKFPRFLMQHDCNVTLFSAPCGVVKATYQINGTLTAATSTQLTVTCSGSNPTPGYYVRGEVWVGTGAALERRMILASEMNGPSTAQILTIDRPLLQQATGQAVSFWPGCDGQHATCRTKFSNGLRFRGHPYMPQDNPALKAVNRKPSNRKK